MELNSRDFGKLKDGRTTKLFELVNNNGMKVCITNYGGIITQIIVPDKNGNFIDVNLGFDTINEYENDSAYLGAIVGRFANRISGAKFSLEGKEYLLYKNDGDNCLHGGKIGFNKKLWNAETHLDENKLNVILTYRSEDMEEGFPGNLDVQVKYGLNNNNEISIEYKAQTDKTTILNLTNHAYFNLKDGGKSSIEDHEVLINADKISPINSEAIPIDDFMNVENTPFDLRSYTNISERINLNHEQLINGHGFDHNFVINEYDNSLKLAAKAVDKSTGIELSVLTSEPGIQFYTGNHLNIKGKGGIKYLRRHGFCLETQHFPDSPNRPNYPSTELRPGEQYLSTTVYKFDLNN